MVQNFKMGHTTLIMPTCSTVCHIKVKFTQPMHPQIFLKSLALDISEEGVHTDVSCV